MIYQINNVLNKKKFTLKIFANKKLVRTKYEKLIDCLIFLSITFFLSFRMMHKPKKKNSSNYSILREKIYSQSASYDIELSVSAHRKIAWAKGRKKKKFKCSPRVSTWCAGTFWRPKIYVLPRFRLTSQQPRNF